jgi:sensor histidine kinase YesM
MKIKFPQYNGRDNLVMLMVTPVFAFVLNALNFGVQYFSGLLFFTITTLVSMLFFVIEFALCGAIAVFFKRRLPSEADLTKRLSLMILSFLITTGLILSALFHLFESVNYFNYQFNKNAFAWSCLALGLINVFLTFLMEGISRYNEWQTNWRETEKLSMAYKQGQLQGLKSQINPHFLFNSLNSLSSLIQDDEEGAEKFLDEMSKVYRYMLGNEDEHLVTLETELKFTNSYMHLLKARYGDGLQLKATVNEFDRTKSIAPLTLQIIIENAFTQNIMSKDDPLVIAIASDGNGGLQIKNNVQPKTITNAVDFDAGLDNLIKKYELLNWPREVRETSGASRVINVPLINQREEVLP